MAKTSTSSARRGRHLVSRDYTSKIRSDAQVRETDRRAKMATAGMIEGFASGVAEYAETLKTNKAGWDKLEKGAEKLHEEGGEGTFSFDKALGREDDPVSKWDKWTTQAPLTDQLSIGKDKFYGVQVAQVGVLGDSAGMLVDKDSDKSLYDYLKIGGNDPSSESGSENKDVKEVKAFEKSFGSGNNNQFAMPETKLSKGQTDFSLSKPDDPVLSFIENSSSPSIITTTQQGHSGTGGASRVDLDTYGTVQHQTGSQSVTAA